MREKTAAGHWQSILSTRSIILPMARLMRRSGATIATSIFAKRMFASRSPQRPSKIASTPPPTIGQSKVRTVVSARGFAVAPEGTERYHFQGARPSNKEHSPSASADAIGTKRRIAIPPAAFVIIVRRAGVVRQPDATSSSYLVREVRDELERNLIRFVRVLWPVKSTAKPQSLRKNLV